MPRGNFRTLVKAVSRDPAMMIWLDLVQSKKESPNENFAREVMELFTLGEGHYTESDVKEAARAFTGYRINQPEQSFRFAERQFDPGVKTFMGKTGPWDGDQILDIIISQPECARFITSKDLEILRLRRTRSEAGRRTCQRIPECSRRTAAVHEISFLVRRIL